MLTKYRTIN